MAFEGANGPLRLRVDPGGVLVAGEEFGVGSKEPCSCVGINNPMTPAPGVPNFGFKGPAVRSEINQFRGVILTRRRYQFEAGTENGLLPPFAELVNAHRSTTYQVHRKPKCCRQKSRAIRQCLRAKHCPMEI